MHMDGHTCIYTMCFSMHFQDETGLQAQVESRCHLALKEDPTQLLKTFFYCESYFTYQSN